MLLNAPISSDKTVFLVDKYVELINKGISASNILVIVQNSVQKNNFLKGVLKKIAVDAIESPRISSFNSIIYNSINDNWAFLENSLTGKSVIIPNNVGLEITQYILNKIIKDVKFRGYNSKKSLLHQIFRRYSLIVQNNLNDDEVKWRSEDVLKESFSDDAKITIHRLLKETLKHRSLDYLRQGLIFSYLYKNSDYFNNVEYLIIDNADELTPHCIDFINVISNNLKDIIVACDEKGSSRCGYLAADKNVYLKFKEFCGIDEKLLPPNSLMSDDAGILYSNVLNNKTDVLSRFEFLSHSKRSQMISFAVDKIVKLLNLGTKPSDISVITPVIDDLLKFQLAEGIHKNQVNLKYITGSGKTISNSIVVAAFSVLKLVSNVCDSLTQYDARMILQDIVGVPIKYCREILDNFQKFKSFINFNFEYERYSELYAEFLQTLENLKAFEDSLSKKMLFIFDKMIKLNKDSVKDIERFNFCVKQIQDFETVFGEKYVLDNVKDILIQIENSIISENPYGVIDFSDDEIIVSTPQKIIDFEIQTKYQIWLDVSSDEWIKNDTGPLYNAWVFQKDWDKDKYTVDDELVLSRTKNARLLRKLVLCADKNIFAYSSLFDSLGVENFGGIEKYINSAKSVNKNVTDINPRDDQKPVLAYQNGKMAISAVPGAGKTTILLALIIKLLEDKINPEKIFVLTYMDSAARNFRERIKNVCQDLNTLPNISTIHGLALKILKENGNFVHLNLPPEFEICDETKRYSIIQSIASVMHLNNDVITEFDRALSVFKMSGANFEGDFGEFLQTDDVSDKKVLKFIDFYNQYQKHLSAENAIDYDDMLIYSVKLLEENEEIRKYYQNICEYIIEDEAQDSSVIQQKLISLLSAKHGNLIRCGDINQAITTTFSNADVEGFREFIKNSNPVEMNCSQRCAKEIFELANNLVDFTKNDQFLKGAFYDIKMAPVEGKNPVESKSVYPISIKTLNLEETFVLNTIRQLLADNPNATVGILLRNNFQVADWISLIENAGFKTISRTDCLNQKTVFKVIISILKFVDKPFENEVVLEAYKTFSELGYYKKSGRKIICDLQTPFIEVDIDNIEHVGVSQFYWDMLYWLQFPTILMGELVSKIGFAYFSSEIDIANIYLISTLVKRLEQDSTSNLISKLEMFAAKPVLRGFKFFSEVDDNNDNTKGSVQIMTYHKSKGDEFDYVFLPTFTEKNLPIDFDSYDLRPDNLFMENIRSLNKNYVPKSDLDMKKSIIDEHLRLLYVAVTRAKRKLFISVPKTKLVGRGDKKKNIPVKENLIFSKLFNDIMEVE